MKIESETSSSVQISITATLKWNDVLPESWMTSSTIGGPVYPTVPTSDYWHWTNLRGKFGTTAYDGIMGAPEVIVRYVKSYLGFWSSSSPIKFKLPVGVMSEVSTDPGKPTSFAPIYYAISPWLNTGEPITPDAARTGVNSGKCLYFGQLWDIRLYPYTTPPMQNFLTGAAVNYHISQTPSLLDRGLSASGKTLWDFKITSQASLGMSNPYNVWHFITAYYTNLVNQNLIYSNLPYKSSPSPRGFKN